ncbi:CHAT domain-containing protein [Lentzea alba]|uniref:CHAT domain-containing protein n=1 Tax=Lentzea alba TaxID=2714351 RepID=UPI0039BF2EC5
MGFRVRFTAVAVAVAAWGIWIGWRRYTLAFLPEDSVFGNFGYVINPETGRRLKLTAPPAFMVAGYPLLLLSFLGVMVMGFRGHVSDIKVGWRALRERPVVVGLGTAVLAALPALCLTISYAIHVTTGNVSFRTYLALGFFLDVPLTVTIFGTIFVATVYFAVIGPWMIDHIPRMLGWLGMLKIFNGGALTPEQIEARVARLEKELTARPYRNQVVVTVMAQMQAAKLDGGESVDDAMLRTMTLIPALEEPSLLHVFSPSLYDADERCQFARTLVKTYRRTDSRAHLDVAIRLLEGIRRRPPLITSRRRRAEISLILADALHLRDEPGDLVRAHDLVDEAARISPDEARRTRAILLLADGSDLDEAIATFRDHDGDEMRLAAALLRRHELSHDQADLEEALGCTRGLLCEPGEDDPEVLRVHLAVLAHMDNDDSPELLDALARVDALTDPPWELAHQAATVKGFRALESGDVDGAMTHLDQVLRLVVEAASLGLSRADRQSVLRRSLLTPSSVAALALMSGRVERAVELLELGRTVIWWQVRELRVADAGDHAPRLAEIRKALQQPNYSESGSKQDVLAVHRQAVSRAELAREWDGIVQRQAFGHEIRFAELREAARGGPVVLVTTTPAQCDAIIVLADHDPVHVPLPDLTEADAAAWAEGLLHAEARRMNARAIAPRLWDAVAAPVLAAVEPHLGEDRRIWWCPTGALTSVPMHLAARNGNAVLDEVVSSYTPSLWSLLDARLGERPRTTEPTMLITSLHDTPPRPDGTTWAALPHADQEAEQIAARIPGATRLAERDATVAAVKDALPGSTWAHFASHGDLRGLVLHDGSLGIDELAGLDLGGNEVAFLSACVTAVPDSQNLDEALHPAAALHLQGFSHVIGTLWNIRSDDGPVVADDFYTHLLDDAPSALALHEAQRRLRTVAPDDPARWAPFVHIGP